MLGCVYLDVLPFPGTEHFLVILETERLILRQVLQSDAAFIRDLMNEPAYLKNIGDRGVRTVEDATAYVNKAYITSYETKGFGLYLVCGKPGLEPLGICGLVDREGLEGIDLGYGFMSAFWGRGYAREAAAATVKLAREKLEIDRLIAITAEDNGASIGLLEHLGFSFEKMINLPHDDEEVRLYSLQTSASVS